jgi:predicted MFS family arabinose efflux permease
MPETATVTATRPSAARTLLPGTAMIAVTFGLARYGYGLLLPDMRADVQMTASTAGFISSAAYLSYMAANIGVVSVLTRWGPRVAVGAAALLAAVGMGVIAGAQSVLLLAAGVVLAGAAAGMSFPPYADIVAGQVSPAKRDVVWSTISSGTGWGVALAGPIAIVAGAQWRVAWAIFVVLAVVVGALAVFHAPAAEDRRARRPQLSITWFFCPRSRPLLLSALVVGLGSSVWWAFSVDAMRAAGIDTSSARLTYAACGVAMLLASFSGALFARFGLRPSYLVSTALLAASLAAFGLATANLATALVATVVFGAVYAAVIAVHGVWSSRVFEDHPSAGLAAVNTALTIGTLAGPTLAGIVIEQADYRAALVIVAVLTLAALPFSPPTVRRKAILAAHTCTAAPVRD